MSIDALNITGLASCSNSVIVYAEGEITISGISTNSMSAMINMVGNVGLSGSARIVMKTTKRVQFLFSVGEWVNYGHNKQSRIKSMFTKNGIVYYRMMDDDIVVCESDLSRNQNVNMTNRFIEYQNSLNQLEILDILNLKKPRYR